MSNKSKGFDKIRYKTMINERNDQRINAIENLKNSCTEENLWQAIVAFQNFPFYTASGLPFYYSLKTGRNGELTKELWVNRRENSKSLAWSSVKMAFKNCQEMAQTEEVVKRPKSLGDIRGVSYIYPLFWKFGLIRVPEKVAEKMQGNEIVLHKLPGND